MIARLLRLTAILTEFALSLVMIWARLHGGEKFFPRQGDSFLRFAWDDLPVIGIISFHEF